jgi:hypothetical protein
MTDFLTADTFKAGLVSQGTTTVPDPVNPTDAVNKRSVPNEVVVSTTEPTDPLVEFWINPAALAATVASGTGLEARLAAIEERLARLEGS